jgi:hypothetical protein
VNQIKESNAFEELAPSKKSKLTTEVSLFKLANKSSILFIRKHECTQISQQNKNKESHARNIFALEQLVCKTGQITELFGQSVTYLHVFQSLK